MINIGIYHPFTFTDSVASINTKSSLQVPVVDCLIMGTHPSISVLEYGTNINAAATITPVTWTVDGESFSGHRLIFNVPNTGKKYYLKIGNVFSYNVIEYSTCISEILIKHECNNQHYDWASNDRTLQLLLPKFIEMPPVFQAEDKIVVGDTGIKKKTINQVQRKRVQFLGPPGLVNYLNAIKVNSDVQIQTQDGYVRVKNIEVVAQEQNSGTHYTFELSFEDYDSKIDSNDCCDMINLDAILAPDIDNTNTACNNFSIALVNNSNTLSVTLTTPPVGTPLYKWFLNSNYLTSSSTLVATLPGDYRVEVTIGSCKKTAYFYKEDICEIFKLDVTVVGNSINAAVSNAPTSVTYRVLKDNTQVATSIPYVATTEGTYFVEATSGSCKRIKGVIISGTDACNYSVSITDQGDTLLGVTTASNPVYLWELETSTGIVTIGNTAQIAKTSKGIYWLTVSAAAGCSKKAYKYVSPTASVICSTMNRATGTVFNMPEINLLSSAQPGVDYLVTVNNSVYTYVGTTPVLQNNYSINTAGQLIFASSFPLNLATIKVLLL